MSMSTSDTRATIRLGSPIDALELSVIDSSFREVARGIGELTASVDPGLYELRFRAGPRVTRELVALRPGEVYADPAVTVPFPSAAPVRWTESANALHLGAAEAASARLTRQASEGNGGLVVVVRNVGDRDELPLDESALSRIALLDERLRPVPDFAPAQWTVARERGWAAWVAPLAPGGYALRNEREAAAIDRSLWISPGWQTLVFIRLAEDGPAVQSMSVQMSPLRVAWNPFADARVGPSLELVFWGLREGRSVVPRDVLDLVLGEEFRNPMLGLVVAQSLLLAREPDAALLDDVVSSLGRQVPDHPDFVALVAASAALEGRLREDDRAHRRLLPGKWQAAPDVRWPPMLAASYASLVRLDAQRRGTIAAGSPVEAIAPRVLAGGIWTTWRALPDGDRPSAGADETALPLVARFLAEASALVGTPDPGAPFVKRLQLASELLPTADLAVATGLPTAVVERSLGAMGLRELRLALVCRGDAGSSPYLHGTTRELHGLVRGSTLLEVAREAPSPSESVYRDLLADQAAERGVRTRVVIDRVVGSSAAGVSAIFLGKALAHDLPQEAARELVLGRHALVELPGWLDWLARLLRRTGLFGPDPEDALPGALLEALDAMDERTAHRHGESLVPEGGVLDLRVPLRAAERDDASASVHEGSFRCVFGFRFVPGERDDFERGDNDALAFTARALASGTGRIPAIAPQEFHRALPGVPARELTRHRLRGLALLGLEAERLEFAPVDDDSWLFELGLEAPSRGPAVEVGRRLLYDDVRRRASRADAVAQERLDRELGRVREHNEGVRELRGLIESGFERVATLTREVIGPLDAFPADVAPEALDSWTARVEDAAAASSTLTYAAYARRRMSDAIGSLARTIAVVCNYPRGSAHAEVARAVVRHWAEARGLFAIETRPNEEQAAFVRDHDLAYRKRRLRFALHAIDWWYRDAGGADGPPRAELDFAKDRLYDGLELLENTAAAVTDGVSESIERTFEASWLRHLVGADTSSVGDYAEARSVEIDEVEALVRRFTRERLATVESAAYRSLASSAAEWPTSRRRELLVRYLGFPLWDVMLHPAWASHPLGERGAIELVRLGTWDSTLIAPPGGVVPRWRPRRTVREHDYLWGRLDTAEQLVGLVLGRDHPRYHWWCTRAFVAILDEEEAALPHVRSELEAARAQLSA